MARERPKILDPRDLQLAKGPWGWGLSPLNGLLYKAGDGPPIYFGATCRACSWEVSGRSFAVALTEAEDHQKVHGEAGNLDLVDIWKEDGI